MNIKAIYGDIIPFFPLSFAFWGMLIWWATLYTLLAYTI
jgi:hypothetical protein